jgi:hypothetical protein|tara:strand:- start:955 stop:1137 length:183 start_codon:yes stop_codon:yes gene_type:complete
MAREDVKKVIDSIEAGDNVSASNAFSSAMVDKQKEAIDTKRLDVQLDWLNKQEQPANEEV